MASTTSVWASLTAFKGGERKQWSVENWSTVKMRKDANFVVKGRKFAHFLR
jgi:hypothetical protein